MWRELLVALSLTVCCFLIHGIGVYAQLPSTLGLVQKIGSLGFVGLARSLGMIIRFLVTLLILHSLEIAIWAQFYILQHSFHDRETAYYFSLMSYTTVGYGDVVISHPWRLMGGLEAMTGVMMFGLSTSSLVALLTRFREVREHLPAGA